MSKPSSDIAYAEALKKIENAKKRRAKKLDLTSRTEDEIIFNVNGTIETAEPLTLDRLPPDLAMLTDLTELNIAGCPITDSSPLKPLERLTKLNISGTKISSLLHISGLKRLTSLNLSNSPVSSLDLITNLTKLEDINADGTKLKSLAPVSGFSHLKKVQFAKTAIKSVDSLKSCRRLQSVDLEDTEVEDLEALAELAHLQMIDASGTLVSRIPTFQPIPLQRLYLRGTKVADLRPLKNLKHLQVLDIRGTPCGDLAPARHCFELDRLSDFSYGPAYAYFRSRRGSGLMFAGSLSASYWPFSALALLPDPERSIETLNYLRRENSEKESWPKHYPRPQGIEQIFAPISQNEEIRGDTGKSLIALEAIQSRPSTHDFSVIQQKIGASPHKTDVPDLVLTEEIKAEVAFKTHECISLFNNTNAAPRFKSALTRLSTSVAGSFQDLNAGRLLMLSRTIDAEVRAYDTATGRQEVGEIQFSAALDLQASLNDLKGCFPQLARLEAETITQGLLAENADEALGQLIRVVETAQNSPQVHPSAVEALLDGRADIEAANDRAQSAQNTTQRSDALESKSRAIAQSLLDARKFVARAFREAASEAGKIGSDAMKEAREHGGNAAYAIGIASLATALANPTIALAAFAATFRPLREYAKDLIGQISKASKDPKGDSGDST